MVQLGLEFGLNLRRNVPAGFVPMNLGDILQQDQIITDLQASNRWEAIDELIDSLVPPVKLIPNTGNRFRRLSRNGKRP